MATLNLQVGASADDGYSYSQPGYGNNDTTVITGQYLSFVWMSWHRFTGVSGLSGATINSADFQLYEVASVSGALTKLYADDSEAPAAPTDRTDHLNKTRTTAGVDWDGDPGGEGFNSAPDISTVIQELADSHDPSAIQILHDDDGSADNNYIYSLTYDIDDNLRGAKLDIDYDVGSMVWVDYGDIVREIDEGDYVGESFFFEATMFTNNVLFPVYARLWNITDSEVVDGSELQTTSTTPERLRSSELTLVGVKEYKVQMAAQV